MRGKEEIHQQLTDRVIHIEFTPLPANFKQILSNPSNKTTFGKFLLNQMEIWLSADISDSKEIYIGLQKTRHVTNRENEGIVNPTSDHVEADSGMFVLDLTDLGWARNTPKRVTC